MPTPKLKLTIPPSEADQFLSAPSEAVIKTLAALEGDVLVLGAGGKMGLHVCSMLQRADQRSGRASRVIAVSRFSSVHGKAEFENQGIHTIACDLEDDDALNALPDAPSIIFMAGAKFGTGDQPDLLRRMNVELPRRVAKRFGGARCIVFSTGCVYSMVTPETGGSVETDPTDPPGAYARSCLERELAFTAAAHEHGSKVALIRLNYATEFRYGVLVDLAQRVLDGQPINLGMGWVNLIWQRDAVDQILQAFPLASTEPFILNITGPEIWSIRKLGEAFGKLLDREPIFTGNEEGTAWLNNPAKSHGYFGKPSTSMSQMMEWTAAWLLTTATTFGKPTGFENREGKF